MEILKYKNSSLLSNSEKPQAQIFLHNAFKASSLKKIYYSLIFPKFEHYISFFKKEKEFLNSEEFVIWTHAVEEEEYMKNKDINFL